MIELKEKPKLFTYEQNEDESIEEYFDRVIDESFVNMGWDL